MKFFDTTITSSLGATVLVAIVAFTLASCDGLSGNSGSGSYDEPLEITGVRYQSADSVDEDGNPIRPDTLSPGDRIAIEGRNMDAVANVYFLGYEAGYNPALSSQEYLIATVPNGLPFGELSAAALDSLDAIRVTNDAGEATYNELPVLPPGPVLQSMSNEYADPGEDVTVTGSFLYLAEAVTLPDGTTIPGEQVEASPDGSEATFTIPQSATPEEGAITYETSSGTDDSPPFVYRDTRGVLLNFDDHSSWQGWNAVVASSSESEFGSGAEGSFAVLQGDGEIPTENNEWYSANRSINLNNQEWVAPENLDEPPENFAVKFELNIQQEWAAGSILIYLIETATDNYSTGYAYRVKPWLQSDGSVSAVNWTGWRTITVPLSQFRDPYGDREDGSTPSSLTELLGEDGVAGNGGPDNNPPSFRLVNYSESVVPPGQAFAVDNIRVVRIAGGE